MAAQTTTFDQDIEAFCNQLRRSGIRPERVILFGSWASGRQRPDSDIDLIVVSKDFRGRGLRRRLELLGMTAGDALVPVQALGYTPEELAAPEPTSFLAIVLSQKTVEIPLPPTKSRRNRKTPTGTGKTTGLPSGR